MLALMCVFVYLFLLQLYQGVFELEFLKETEKLYYTESLRMMRDPEFTVSLIHMYSTQCLLHVQYMLYCHYVHVISLYIAT